MPNRILREGIVSSPRMAKLGWAEEVFYRRLMSVVDDFGRFSADPGMLRAACYPRQLKQVSDSDIEKWLTAVSQPDPRLSALVRVYPASDGERYLQLLNFNQQVRAKRSKYPDPSSECVADAEQAICDPPADAHLDVSVSVSVPEGEGVTRPRKARATPLPAGFSVSERVRQWASENGFARLDEHLSAFVRKCKAKGYEYVDWDSALMEAIREDWAKLRGARPAPAGESKTVPSAQADMTVAYLAAQRMTPEEKAKADEVRKRVMAGVGVINRESA